MTQIIELVDKDILKSTMTVSHTFEILFEIPNMLNKYMGDIEK